MMTTHEWDAKRAALTEPHIEPLTAFVRQVRQERSSEDRIPDFDPNDGGLNAEVLFVLEAPGPKAIATGFVSRDNPDLTARNLKTYLAEAGISRKQSLIWNIVPWYLGDGKTIRAVSVADIRAGSVFLEWLLGLLPHLKVIVLVGRKAQAAFDEGRMTTLLPVYRSAHPSPQWVHRHPNNAEKIGQVFREVALRLNGE